MFKLFNFCRSTFCRFSTSPVLNVIEKLKERSLVKVSGKDAENLVQGLITNDIQHLSRGPGSMFALFLNNKGRVLYDSIIYKTPESNSFLVEVDKNVVNAVCKHLNMYKLKRDVAVTNIDEQLHVWAFFDPDVSHTIENISDNVKPSSDLFAVKSFGKENIMMYRDPRLSTLGTRIIASPKNDSKISELFGEETEPKYKLFRYRLGVGEGINDLPPEKCFPLEANGDYLHGISFHKGCYIGQELTARTYHTGVTRKRLMPLFFKNILEKAPEKDEIVKVGEHNVGKIRGVEKDTGLGLLRVTQVLSAKSLVIDKTSAHTVRPNWWPLEAPKEKVCQEKL